MKLNLKRLRAHPDRRQPFHEQVALRESDFHEPVTLHGPLQVRGWALWSPDEVVTLELALGVEVDQVCSRCLQPVRRHVAHHERTTLQGTPTVQLLADDFSYVTGTAELDLTPMLVGFVLSHLDAKPLCRPDCQGLCPRCGANLNVAPCACDPQSRKDPRLAVLQRWLEP